MPLGAYSITALAKKDASGLNIVKESAVTVRDVTNVTPQTIYSDAAGTSTITQPAETDANGNLSFYVEAGRYACTVGGVTKIIEVFASTNQLTGVERTASFTLDATMNGQVSIITGAADVVLTVPKEATTDLSLSGDRIFEHTICFLGTGSIEVEGEDGTVTIQEPPYCLLTASQVNQWFTISKLPHATNYWALAGNMDSAI